MTSAVGKRGLLLARPCQNRSDQHLLRQSLAWPCGRRYHCRRRIGQAPSQGDVGLDDSRREQVQATPDCSDIGREATVGDITPLLRLVELTKIVRGDEEARENQVGAREKFVRIERALRRQVDVIVRRAWRIVVQVRERRPRAGLVPIEGRGLFEVRFGCDQ